ncbi:MAG: hypothetical protein FWB99_01465, partial [Treponema sp.]|nr:hypothetical protein [Treponema sp.]
PPGQTSSGTIGVAGDVMLGAKIQIIGREAPIQSDMFRVAFAPGLMIPVPGPDFDDQLRSGTPRVARLDNHVFGVGLRSFFDWVPNQFFYLNFYNEVRFFPQRGRFRDLGFAQAFTADTLDGPPFDVGNPRVNFRYDVTFEIEPTFTYRLEAPIIAFEVGLPLTYFFTPGYRISGTRPNIAPLVPAIGEEAVAGLNAAMQDEGSVHMLTLGPNVSAFFMQWPVPMEFRLSYTFPLWGQNAPLRHVVTLQIRTYFRI